MSRQLKLVLGFAFFALFFVHAGVGIYRTVSLPISQSSPGWTLSRRAGRLVVGQVTGADAGRVLRAGDELVAINGQPIRADSQIGEFFQKLEPGSPYTLAVQRSGELLQLTLRTEPFPIIWFNLIRAARVIIPAIFLITGFAVFLVKPFDKQATLLALMFALFDGAIPLPPASDEAVWVTGVSMAVGLLSVFFASVFFHFFLIFPEPSPLLKRFPRLEGYLYFPHLLTSFLFYLGADLVSLFAKSHTALYRQHFDFVLEAGFILTLAYIAGGLASLLLNYRRASLVSRRKLRVVVAGSVAGFLPPLVLIGGALLLYALGVDMSGISPELMQWLFLLVAFAILLFPLSFAYAIVRHQVIPVRLIIRRGVRYLLVSRGFIIVEAIVVFALLSLLLSGERIGVIDRLGRRADILVTAIVTAAAVLLLRTLNRRVMPAIDRRFFREAYSAQQMLSQLAQSVRAATTVDQMLDLALVKLQDAFHPENIAVFLCEESSGDYVLAASSVRNGEGRIDSSLEIANDWQIVRQLRESAQPLTVELGDAKSWPGSRHSEIELLRQIRSALLLPVMVKDRLLGIISLGQRLAELPFSREDREMLMAVAWQMGLALENARLIHQVAEEERLRREVEIATDVQRRLFPQRPPESPHLDLSGVCIPAQGVGGDYYDFLTIGTQIGIAVADVAGKGVSAALLMSIVQASLRSQVAAVNGRLTDLVSSMNELLHRSTGPQSFASFFFAQYDPSARLLTYVNAGHNPPVLVRAVAFHASQGAEPLRLEASAAGDLLSAAAPVIRQPSHLESMRLLTTGGTVIGAFGNAAYEQESLAMHPGDVIIAYTDGLTEARSPDGEEFGEARLLQIAGEHRHLSACELSDRIVSSVQGWCRDTPQHDDLTVVIMKVR